MTRCSNIDDISRTGWVSCWQKMKASLEDFLGPDLDELGDTIEDAHAAINSISKASVAADIR